ncbi:MAG: hypothetical protein GY896_01325 [Gammaproteobacteria bacterium]|nr:hypothetical protein [Gammaproteobacteria bacterium]
MDDKRFEQLVSVAKFLIGTVVLGGTTTAINYHIQKRQIETNYQIQQREIETNELEQLGKFIDHAIDENVAVRQRFAEYFATVSRSEEARTLWVDYKVKLDQEQTQIEAKEESLQKQKDNEAAKVQETEKLFSEALKRVAVLEKSVGELSSGQEAENLISDLNKQRRELENAQIAQFEAEQRIATLALELDATKQQLQYPTRKPVGDKLKSGWVYIGNFDTETVAWTNTYFDIPPDFPPEALKNQNLIVSAAALNVRSGMPGITGKNAPAIDALKQGAIVQVIEAKSWFNTGFTWARVTY